MDQIPAGAIPVDQFQSAAPDASAPSSPPPGAIPIDQFQSSDDAYGSTGQKILTGLEGAAQGFAGPLATLAEQKLAPYAQKAGIDLSPEAIQGREAAHPYIHGGAEIGTFAGSLLTGTGEAAVLGKIGEGAAHLAGLGDAANVGSKLASAAVRAATEMGFLQAGDEVSKNILGDPDQTMGSAAANIGTSALLGGAGGALFSGIGQGISKAIDGPMLKDFMDRLSFRKANIDPNEMMRNEFATAHQALGDMGSEIGGADGIKSQALGKLMPQEATPQIQKQASSLLSQLDGVVQSLTESGDKTGARALSNQADQLRNVINTSVDPVTMQATNTLDPKTIYDTMNGIKRQLGEWSKFNQAFTPFSEQEFRNAVKGLGSGFKNALEDSSVWGKKLAIFKKPSIVPGLM